MDILMLLASLVTDKKFDSHLIDFCEQSGLDKLLTEDSNTKTEINIETKLALLHTFTCMKDAMKTAVKPKDASASRDIEEKKKEADTDDVNDPKDQKKDSAKTTPEALNKKSKEDESKKEGKDAMEVDEESQKDKSIIDTTDKK